MSSNYDRGPGPCEPSCIRPSAERIYPIDNVDAIIMPADGIAKTFSQHIGEDNAFEITIRQFFFGNGMINTGCGDVAPPIGKIWAASSSGSSMAGTGGASSTNSNTVVHVKFYCPYDLWMTASSYQTGGEFIILSTGPDEFRRGQGGRLTTGFSTTPLVGDNRSHRENVYDGIRYDDDQGPSDFIWRNIDEITFQPVGNSLQSNWFLAVLLGPEQWELQRCNAYIEDEGCTPTTSPRWQMGCVHTAADPDWFQDFAAGAPWEYSNDSGATWVPAPASAPHTAGDAAGLHRWRQQITIPAGYRGFWYVQIIGDDPTVNLRNVHGEMHIDGALMSELLMGGYRGGVPAANGGFAWSGGYREVPEAGETVTFEWREGAWTTTGVTTPIIEGRLGGVRKLHQDVQVLECMDDAGAIVNTNYFDAVNDLPVVPAANQVATLGRCTGCEQ